MSDAPKQYVNPKLTGLSESGDSPESPDISARFVSPSGKVKLGNIAQFVSLSGKIPGNGGWGFESEDFRFVVLPPKNSSYDAPDLAKTTPAHQAAARQQRAKQNWFDRDAAIEQVTGFVDGHSNGNGNGKNHKDHPANGSNGHAPRPVAEKKAFANAGSFHLSLRSILPGATGKIEKNVTRDKLRSRETLKAGPKRPEKQRQHENDGPAKIRVYDKLSQEELLLDIVRIDRSEQKPDYEYSVRISPRSEKPSKFYRKETKFSEETRSVILKKAASHAAEFAAIWQKLHEHSPAENQFVRGTPSEHNNFVVADKDEFDHIVAISKYDKSGQFVSRDTRQVLSHNPYRGPDGMYDQVRGR